MDAQSAAVERFAQQFLTFEADLNGERSAPIHRIRSAAFERFRQGGFPAPRDEEWRFTNLSTLMRTEFSPTPGPLRVESVAGIFAPYPFLENARYRVTCLNGRFIPELSNGMGNGDGMTVQDLTTALASDKGALASIDRIAAERGDAFASLNTAFVTDGAWIRVEANIAVDEPIYVVHVTTTATDPVVTYPRTVIAAESGSSATVVEVFLSLESGIAFTDAVTECLVGGGAKVTHYRLQMENRTAFHVGGVFSRQERNSMFETAVISIGGGLVRSNVVSVLDGEGSEAVLNGLTLAHGNQHVDNHTEIDHAAPHCTSHELYKGIFVDASRGVFSGKIIVRPDAQKTDAKQSNKNLLLSDRAMVDTKPQLEIFANDVKCTHGATIGRLDDDALFYLRSRGIPATEAANVLTYAFASDLVGRISVDAVREYVDDRIHRLLEEPSRREAGS